MASGFVSDGVNLDLMRKLVDEGVLPPMVRTFVLYVSTDAMVKIYYDCYAHPPVLTEDFAIALLAAQPIVKETGSQATIMKATHWPSFWRGVGIMALGVLAAATSIILVARMTE